MAVLSASQEPEIKLDVLIHDKGLGAAAGFGGYLAYCTLGLASLSPVALFFWPYVCPAAAVVGGAVGAAQAPGTDKGRVAEDTISTALAARTIQESLREQVVAAALAKGTTLVSVAPESVRLAAQQRDYRPLAAVGVDTVLELALTKLGDEGRALWLAMRAHVRLIRTGDNGEFFATDFFYFGGQHTLSEWSANQAELLLRAVQTGYKTLGSHIYDQVFLLYLFPDQQRQQIEETFWVYGLAPIYPRISEGSVDSLQPTLHWQSFPRTSDVMVAPEEMSRVKNVRYDLVIARGDMLYAEVIYRREGLSDTKHAVETSLSPATNYLWSVRACFELDGRERVTEWGGNSRRNVNSTAPYSYPVKTPK